MFRSKSRFKTESSVHRFRSVLVENRIFQITFHTIEKRLKLKCSIDQILAMKPGFVSFDLLGVAIRSLTCLRAC